MAELTAIEKLDRILFLFPLDENESLFKVLKNIQTKYPTIDIRLLVEIFQKLEDDKYIRKDYSKFKKGRFGRWQEQEHYSLTFEGELFKNSGGYCQQFKNEKRKAAKDKAYITAVGIGTALAGLYGFFEIAKWVYHHFHFLHFLKFWS